jgi:hypothetical protein
MNDVLDKVPMKQTLANRSRSAIFPSVRCAGTHIDICGPDRHMAFVAMRRVCGPGLKRKPGCNRGKTAADRRDPQRARLVDAAAYALWNLVVQRECSGFRGTEQVLKDYAIPVEVRAKIGAIRPR